MEGLKENQLETEVALIRNSSATQYISKVPRNESNQLDEPLSHNKSPEETKKNATDDENYLNTTLSDPNFTSNNKM